MDVLSSDSFAPFTFEKLEFGQPVNRLFTTLVLLSPYKNYSKTDFFT